MTDIFKMTAKSKRSDCHPNMLPTSSWSKSILLTIIPHRNTWSLSGLCQHTDEDTKAREVKATHHSICKYKSIPKYKK